MPTLLKLGYRVWAPNQRGYGNSYRPADVAEYKLPNLIDDVAGLIDAAQAKSVVLIAHDWGGPVAWFLAMRKVRPLEKLVVMNSPHPGTFAKHFIGAQMFRSWYMFFFQLPFLPEAMLSSKTRQTIRRILRKTSTHPENFPEEIIQIYIDNVSTPEKARTLLNWYRANFPFEMARQRSLGLPVIDIPTMLIWGDADHALLKETTFGTEAFVSNLTVRYLPGISHWVQEDAPDAVNRMVESFLSGAPVPAI